MNRYPFLNSAFSLSEVLMHRPNASALLRGGEACPGIRGIVRFYQTPLGVVVSAQVSGLPTAEGDCADRIFGFHIHEGGVCEGDPAFSDAGAHYNPENCSHPFHAGDLPPLFGNDGLAAAAFLTDWFTVDALIGRTVIIHDRRDDFTTNPSGDAGSRIACGVIQRDCRNCLWR